MQTINFKKYWEELNFIKNDSCFIAKVSMDHIPPFYLVSDSPTITSIEIKCKDSSDHETLTLVTETTLNSDGTYTHTYAGGDSFANCGVFFLEITSGVDTFYSELFSVEDIEDNKLPFTSDVPACTNLYTDSRDSKTYTTVEIGNRCWMKQSFRYLEGMTSGVDYFHPYNPILDPTYGLVYNYNTIKNTNFLPLGWRLPTEEDFEDLIDAIGGVLEGHKLKAVGTTYWTTPNTGASDDFGFFAVAAGYYSTSMKKRGELNVLFCDAIIYPANFRTYELSYDSAELVKSNRAKTDFVSVRLVRDLTVKLYQDKKDELHLPIKFNELLDIDTNISTIISNSVLPRFVFKTGNETTGVITINQISWDGLTVIPIAATIVTELIEGKRYYYSTEEVIDLDCGLWYFQITDGARVYYSNLLNISDILQPSACDAILITEHDEWTVITEKGDIIILESCTI
jgi:uncharacterized protein (TIGR02145 family)